VAKYKKPVHSQHESLSGSENDQTETHEIISEKAIELLSEDSDSNSTNRYQLWQYPDSNSTNKYIRS
jgi:hypothetical protein